MVEMQTIDIAGVAVTFAKCPTGTFVMGSDEGLPLEQPIRHVMIGQAFWISTTLVTQELWSKVIAGQPSAFHGSSALPVDGVSYDSALAFCDSATAISGQRFALPTEAQWEYACRAGTATEYFWGSSASDANRYGWFDLNARDRTHDVASLAPNPWGLFDIVGNLWEWCADVWHSDYEDAPNSEQAWNMNADRQPRRCLRGGAWNMDVFRLRSAYRSYDHRELGTSRFGMRIVIAS